VGARLGAGGGAVGVFLVIGLALVATRPYVAWTAFALAGLSGPLIGANRLPLLHHLPVVGAPKVKVAFRRVTISGRQRPNEVLIEVGIHAPTRLEDAGYNLLYPADMDLEAMDVNWNAPVLGFGVRMPPTSEPLNPQFPMSSYWAAHRPLPLGDTLQNFALRGSAGLGPRKFKIRFKVQSEKLYRNVQAFDAPVSYP
jgi:hypothetical protein